MFDRSGDQVEGFILLSHEKAHRLHIWDELEKAVRDSTQVSGRVLNKVKGGLAVDIGIVAFLPASQIELRPLHNLDSYIGQDIDVRILKLNRRRGNAVVSHRVLLETRTIGQESGGSGQLIRRRGSHWHGQEPHRIRGFR